MTITIYSAVDGGTDSSNNTTNKTVTFSSAGGIATGDLMYAVAATNNTSAHNLVISDNRGNTWTQIADVNDTRGLGVWQAVANVATNGTTPTVTFGKAGSSVEVSAAIFAVTGEHADLLDAAVTTAFNAGSTAPQVAVGPNTFTNDLVVGFMVTRNVAFATATPLSGYTPLIGNDNVGSAQQLRIITRATTTTGTWTPGWTLSASTFWSAAAFIIKGSTTAPTITGVSTKTPRHLGSLTLTGVNFGATQGTGSVALGGTVCAVTSWSDTSITVTVARGTNGYGTAVSLVVTVNGGATSNTSALVTGILPQAGWAYVTLATPYATTANRLTASADLAAANQVAYDTKGGSVGVQANGTFYWTPPTTTTNVEAWTAADGWGATALETLGAIVLPIVLSMTQLARLIGAAYINPTPFTPVILGIPVKGQALTYVTPGYTGPITSQQWHANAGTSGPVAISGATGSTYTPVTGDVGKWFSVRVTTPSGTYASTEFTATHTVVSQTAVQTAASPGAGLNIGGLGENAGITVQAVSQIRVYIGTHYIDSVLAPGVYAGTTALGNLTAYGSFFSTSLKIVASLSTAACADSLTDTAPSTMTRPGTSTGVGFWTAHGTLYDANGNKWRPRGANRLHWDSNTPVTGTVGLFNTKANCQRMFTDMTQDWTTKNKPLIDDMISTSPNHQCVPIPVIAAVKAYFTGSVSGNTLTVTAMAHASDGTDRGVIAVSNGTSQPNGTGLSGTGVTGSAIITAQLTNTNGSGIQGKEGTYTISGAAQTVASTSTMGYYCPTSGNTSVAVLAAATQQWVEQYPRWAAYERYMILNIVNEWGTAGITGVVHGTISGTTLTLTAAVSAATPIRTRMYLGATGVTPFQIVSATPLTGTAGAIGATYAVTPGQAVSVATSFDDVTWREAYNAMVAALRTAGYKCTIMIDAPGSGQDLGGAGNFWTLTHHGQNVLATDTQVNTMFSAHIYGGYRTGGFTAAAVAMSTAANAIGGPTYCIGEFGPAYQNQQSGNFTNLDALELIAVAEANLLGWLPWALDDPSNNNGGNPYAMIRLAGSYNAGGGGYQTSNPAELTPFGQQVVPILQSLAVPATVFP
jgi:hypothetical protein